MTVLDLPSLRGSTARTGGAARLSRCRIRWDWYMVCCCHASQNNARLHGQPVSSGDTSCRA